MNYQVNWIFWKSIYPSLFKDYWCSSQLILMNAIFTFFIGIPLTSLGKHDAVRVFGLDKGKLENFLF